MTAIVTFEQPVDELTRIALRFEHLYTIARHYQQGGDALASQMSVQALIEILQLLDRPEMRSKFYQETCRLIAVFKRWSKSEDVDNQRLAATMDNLQTIQAVLQGCNGKFANNLRHDAFIKTLIQQQWSPGGHASFNIPAYHYWLQQPLAAQHDDLATWISHLTQFADITSTLLDLFRCCGQTQSVTAMQGFLQTTVDPQIPCHLIRVMVDKHYHVYPRISTGRHGASIRFINADLHTQNEKSHHDIEFKLTCCAI